MTRKARYHLSGAFYHLMLRGNDRQRIFFDDIDRCCMCFLIQQGAERYGHRIHAYCFMSNHIHLLVQVEYTSVSKIVHNLAFRYSQHINKRYHKVGHLFQGRFKSIILDESDYFLKLLRYIHMNPVRAKMVANPEDYFWSGHRTYLGINENIWLTIEHGLAKFDNNLSQSQKCYQAYILQEEHQEEISELRKDFKDGQILGDDDFLKDIRDVHDQETMQSIPLSTIIEETCKIFGVESAILSSKSQSRKISLARGAIVMHAQENGVGLKDIAITFKRDASSLSSLKSRFLMRYCDCNDLKYKIEELRRRTKQLAFLQA